MLTWQGFFFSQTATANRGGNASAASRHRSDWLRRASEAHNAAFIGRLVLRGEGPLMWQGVCHHPRMQLAGGVGAQFNGINLCLRLSSFFFSSVDFADIENLGGWVINKLGNTVWRVNTVLEVCAHAHITPLHPASAAMLQFRFIFLCPDESSDYTVDYNAWPHCSLAVVYVGQSWVTGFLFVMIVKRTFGIIIRPPMTCEDFF